MKKIRRDDEVVVLAGRNRGVRGRVLRVLPDGRLLVSGVNRVKRHTKPNPSINRPAGIVEKEAPIDTSNVAVYNPATGGPGRVGIRVDESGVKTRVFKSDGSALKEGT